MVVTKCTPARGLSAATDKDPQSFMKLLGNQLYRHSSTFVGGGFPNGQLDYSVKESDADVIIVEGSCSDEASELEIVKALDALVITITPYHSDLSPNDFESCQDKWGGRFLGVIINGMTRYMETRSLACLAPSFNSSAITLFGIIPEDRRLVGVSVRQVAEHLQGRFITSETNAENLVEHLMPGGYGMDPAEIYFGLKNHKAVIVRGDRPDVQMAALATDTACLVLTKGIAPIEYVQYEAEEKLVPILGVDLDTLEVMDAMNGLIQMASFDHPLKLKRLMDLLRTHLAWEKLYAKLNL